VRNKTNLKYFDFDIELFFQDYDIDYTSRGKNIGKDWIGLNECPFCGAQGNHFGVSSSSKGYHCWVCGEKGTIPTLIKEILQIDWNEVKEVIKKYSDGKIVEFSSRESGGKVILPSNLSDVNKIGMKYLKDRGFDSRSLVQKYKLKQTGMFSKLNHEGQTSDFRYRIIIPIYMNRQLVSYTGRDYTGKRDPRYRHPFIEACKIPPSSCIYNIDTVKDRCLIVEGPTDVWKLGDGAVSIQGIEFTKEQIRFFYEKKLSKAVIMFDAGKEEKARQLGHILGGCIRDIQIASLEDDDPGSLQAAEALKLKHSLLYN
jgi:DNA primase